MIQSRKTYRIEGLSCANCAGKFERNVRGLASVEEAQVNFGASKIYVTGDPTVEELEGAGAFENLKLTLDERRKPFDDNFTIRLFDIIKWKRATHPWC